MGPSMSEQSGQISSPDATGGAGTFFEQHVNATFLALLLVRGIPPVLTDCQLEEVHFQTEHLGWKTDDVLLVGLNGAGERRQLASQRLLAPGNNGRLPAPNGASTCDRHPNHCRVNGGGDGFG